MGVGRKILIVDDERAIGNFLKATLSHNGYSPLMAFNGYEAISMSLAHNPDLILLDLALPDIDGMEVLTKLREWSDTPIIVVSARQRESDKVGALDAGANDYVTKPFGSNELLARIRAALRQQDKLQNRQQDILFSNGKLLIDYSARLTKMDGRPFHLTPNEYKIVVLLSRHLNKVLTHDYILKEIWGEHYDDIQTLRVNMANIRRKLEPDPAEPRYILTEIGVGYRMAEAP